MSKRYGRNQKRAHRATIAHLTYRLAMESTARMYLPEDGVPDLESFVRVIDYQVTEEGSAGQMVYRTATVSIEGPTPGMLDLIYNQAKVQFKGTQYFITESSQMYDGLARVTLQLTGVTG